jgi:outer membrane protein TolC
MVPLALLGRFVLACSLILPPGIVSAQPLLSLQDAQRMAVGRSQQIVAQDAAALAARELGVAAGQLPDPVLKVGVENIPVNGPDRFSLSRDFMTMRRIGLMQELPTVAKRRLKVERVERDSERIAAERAQAIVTVQRETALAWLDRHYAREMVDLLAGQLRETALQLEGADIAYRSGRGSQADVFAVRAETARLRDKAARAKRQLRGARVALARWIGPEAEQAPSAPIDWRSSAVAVEISSPDHLERLPQLRQLAAQVAAAETGLRQAEADTRADWTVEVMLSQRGSAYSNMVSVGLSIPLQIDRASRQDRATAAQRAALAEARARYQDARVAVEAGIRALLDEWQSGKARLVRLAADLPLAARQRTEAALAAYRGGKGDLVAVLAARRDEIDARSEVLGLEMETARLWAQLAYLVPDTGAVAPTKEQP